MAENDVKTEPALNSGDAVSQADGVFQSLILQGPTQGTIIVFLIVLVLLLLSVLVIQGFFKFMTTHNVSLADNNLRLLTIAMLLPTIAVLAMIKDVDRGLVALISAIAGYILGQAANSNPNAAGSARGNAESNGGPPSPSDH